MQVYICLSLIGLQCLLSLVDITSFCFFFYYRLTVKLTSLFWIMPHLSILLPQEIRCDEFRDRAMSEQDTGADVT